MESGCIPVEKAGMTAPAAHWIDLPTRADIVTSQPGGPEDLCVAQRCVRGAEQRRLIVGFFDSRCTWKDVHRSQTSAGAAPTPACRVLGSKKLYSAGERPG